MANGNRVSNYTSNNLLYDSISLESWIRSSHSEDDIRNVFLNMDRAMKYVHDHGYCVKSFHTKDIELINGKLDQIRFNTLLEMPSNMNERRQYVKEDVYNSSFLQIGIYTKCLYYLKRDYLNNLFFLNHHFRT